jgi:zinc transport system ATP-binding protein
VDNSQIVVNDLSFNYGHTAILENISFSIDQGDFFVLIGPNGGGKSTLLQLMIGILEPTKGTISVASQAPKKMQHRIGYVPQNTNINIDFPITVRDVVLTGLKRKRQFGTTANEKAFAMHALEQVGMEDFAHTKIGALSGGQRQRVFIARALVNQETSILFLDEPTANIDAQGEERIYNLLKTLNETMTIVVVSHDFSMLLNHASSIGYVNKRFIMHDAPTISAEALQHNLGIHDGHVCEAEILQALGKLT